MDRFDNYEEKNETFISKFKQNDRGNVIIESVFINFQHTIAIKFYLRICFLHVLCV